MLLCRNCRTINTADATQCARCKIKDQLIPYNPELTQNWQQGMHKKIKVMHQDDICTNCGTTDHGNADRCRVCKFPLQLKKKRIDYSKASSN